MTSKWTGIGFWAATVSFALPIATASAADSAGGSANGTGSMTDSAAAMGDDGSGCSCRSGPTSGGGVVAFGLMCLGAVLRRGARSTRPPRSRAG